MAPGHAARDHSQWSASASERNFACPGALALSASAAERPENREAAWGTACHEVAEWTLRDPARMAAQRIGDTIGTKAHRFEFDDEMAECTQFYVDFVRQRATNAKFLWIEQKFSLAPLNPPLEAGGTADAVLWLPDEDLLEVVDLKTGRGVVVEAVENFQARTYALGALLANPGIRPGAVRSTIVQPRAYHRDGSIRSETLHIVDMLDWTSLLLEAMTRSAQAMADIDKGTPADFARHHLRTGDHCRFCPAAATCPALEREALAAAQAWFSNDGAVKVPDAPDTLDADRLVRLLDAADMIQDWINSVRAYAHAAVEGGAKLASEHGEYILVAKQARRKWTDEAAAEAALSALLGEQAYTRKLVSPAQAEAVLGKKKDPRVAALCSAVSSGTNLVRADRTSRPAETPKVRAFFDPIT